MSGFGFDMGIEGGESLDALALALKQVPLHLTEEVHINALKKAAEPLKQRIDVTAPEDTGLMSEDLRIAKTKFKKYGEYQVIVGYRKRRDGHGHVAHFSEFGTEKQPAKPFMRPADEKTKLEQETIYTEAIQQKVDKLLVDK